jgi:hypothetical protein
VNDNLLIGLAIGALLGYALGKRGAGAAVAAPAVVGGDPAGSPWWTMTGAWSYPPAV